MPTPLISPGPVTPITQNVVYALPASPCTITTGVTVQKSTAALTGPFTDWVGSPNGVYNKSGGWIKCVSGNSTVLATKVKMSSSVDNSYSQVVLADKPSNYWRLGETSGLVAVDMVGGFNGTISGAITLNQVGPLADGNKAMLFGGAGNKILGSSVLTIGLNATIEYWIKTGNFSQLPVFSNRNSPTTNAGLIYAGINAGTTFLFGNIGGALTGIKSVIDSTWHLIDIIIEPTKFTSYVDGLFDNSVSVTRNVVGTGTVAIGFDDNAGDSFIGSVDEVAIYPYALSPSQISNHYKARTYGLSAYAQKTIQLGASNYWQLNETSGLVAADMIGGKNGTISGGVVLNGADGMFFDGADDLVTIPILGNFGSNVTLEFWLRCAYVVLGVHKYIIMIGSTISSGPLHQIGFNNYADVNAVGVTGYNSAGATGSATVTPPADGLWHQYAIVFNSSTSKIQLFIDAIKKTDDATAPGTFNFTDVSFLGGSASHKYLGSTKDVAIYPRALTAAEILAHYQAGLP